MTIKLKTTSKNLTLNIKNPEDIDSFVKHEKENTIMAIGYRGKMYDIMPISEEEFFNLCPHLKNK